MTNGFLSPKNTQNILRTLNHFPKKKLGQNFLIDGNIVRKSLELAAIQQGDTVVEVGPGLGTLTGALLEAGAQLWSVEYDPNLYAYIAEKLLPLYPEQLHLLHADALDFPLAKLPEDTTNYKIVANLPYAISTPWLEGVLSAANLPSCMVLMLQKEAAERFTASPGSKSMGAISILLNSAYEATSLHKVSGGCFYPRPDIDSVLIQLSLKQAPFIFPASVKTWLRSIFTQRRKQLGSIIRQYPFPDAHKWEHWLAANPQCLSLRPEAIDLKTWQALA